jgi:acetyl-CoA acyltransferase
MTRQSRAAIIAAARSALGTARKGTLANMQPTEVAKPIVAAAVERSGLGAADFDDLVLAESLQGGGDSARYIAVDLGFESLPGAAVNRQCASGLTAIAFGAGQIAAGMSNAILAGGMESMSNMPQFLKRKPFTTGKEADDWQRWSPMANPIDSPDAPPYDMSITVAHNCAVEYGITREDQDAWALRSHERAIKAIDAGSFVDEIVPIEVPQQDGSTITFKEDEHPRRNSSMETLAGLKVLHPEIEGFTVTAGNSSGTNDGAAVVRWPPPAPRNRCWPTSCPGRRSACRPSALAAARSTPSRRRWTWPGSRSPMWRCSRSTRHSRRRPWPARGNWASMRIG